MAAESVNLINQFFDKLGLKYVEAHLCDGYIVDKSLDWQSGHPYVTLVLSWDIDTYLIDGATMHGMCEMLLYVSCDDDILIMERPVTQLLDKYRVICQCGDWRDYSSVHLANPNLIEILASKVTNYSHLLNNIIGYDVY